jgi:hypothetical protein
LLSLITCNDVFFLTSTLHKEAHIMITLPRTRGFSAGNWQVLLTKQPECGPLMACTSRLRSLRRSREQILLANLVYMEPDKTARRLFKTPQMA